MTIESRWISVKERLPNKDGEYAIVCRFAGMDDPMFGTINFRSHTWDKAPDLEISHWLPLPDMPKDA